MSDDFNSEVNLAVNLSGVDNAQTLLKALQKSFDDLTNEAAKSGKDLSGQLEVVTKAISALNGAMDSGKDKVAKYAEGFGDLVQKVQETTKALREAAQLNVVGGSTTPLQDMASGMSLAEAKEILAVQKARGLTAEQVASEVVSAHERETAAAKKAADAEVAAAKKATDARAAAAKKAAEEQARLNKLVQGAQGNLDTAKQAKRYAEEERGLDAVAVATLRVTRAQQELAKAEAQTAAASKSGNKANVATGLNAQATATHNLTAAEGQLYQAQQAVAKNTGNLAGGLPRLRYALYDVSTTLAFAGAAMLGLATATVGTAIAMDRQFADVVRTTGTYLDETGTATAKLRDEFNQLFTSLPASWSDLTDIGTLAGQLNIASEDVAEFTKLVAQFAATTDVSVDQAATAFGRLSQLLSVPAAEYENLGSSILQVGVNSVATESQIINTSTQIAAMGDFAGFTADEVVGLSAALASLGIQPELARGTITRLFTNIGTAISDNTAKLDVFGEVAGTTGDQFATAWGDHASDALYELLTGLGELSDSDALTALKQMGITASRDIPTILKLAQNHEVLAKTLAEASQGYENGSTLGEQYGVVAETVSSKLTILKNNLQELFAQTGKSSGALGPVIDFITKLIQAFTAFVSSPVGQVASIIMIAFTALGGVLGILAGAAARGVASMLALITAFDGAGISAGVASKGVWGLTSSMIAMGGAARATGLAIRAAFISTGIGAAIAVIGTALAFVATSADNSKAKLDAYGDSLKTAIGTDTQEGDASIRRVAISITDAGDAADDAQPNAVALANAMVGLSDDSGEAADGVDTLNQNLDQLYVNLGKTTDAAVRKGLADLILGDETDPGKQKARIDAINTGLASVGVTYDQLRTSIESGRGLPAGLTELYNSLDAATKAQSGYVTGTYEGDDAVMTFLSSLRDQDATFQNLVATTGTATEVMAQFGLNADGTAISLEGVGNAGEEGAGGIDDWNQALFETLGTITDVINATNASEGSIYNLGKSLYDNGNAWSQFGQAGRANIVSLLSVMDALAKESGGSTQQTAADFQALYEFLINGNFATAESLDFLRQAILSLTNGKEVQSSGRTFDSFWEGYSGGATQAAQKTREVQEEVRTLLDYVNDLKKVMSDAFDFRFGLQISKDDYNSAVKDITQGFIDARQKVKDLNVEIKGIKATIAGLKAERGTLEYFLSIAVEYGDTLRAAEIQAQLAENYADTADAQNELTKTQDEAAQAQKDAKPTLTGNTQAAIDQRAAVMDLVQGVEDQIAAYAAQGHSAEEVAAYAKKLKADLEEQLLAWGYNTAEVKKYTDGIDDFVEIINSVPRDLTVKADADTSPAQKALDIFIAEANKRKATVTVGATGDGYTAGKNAGKSYGKGWGEGVALTRPTIKEKKDPSVPGGKKYYAVDPDTGRMVGRYFFDRGGYTGRGGKHEPAGIVHKGEYVVPKEQVNQSTGLPYADAFNRISKGIRVQAPSYASGGFASQSWNGPISLSAGTIQQIARAVQPYVVVDGKVLASATDKAYVTGTRVGSN